MIMEISAEGVRSGDERIIARVISQVENQRQQVFPLLKELYRSTELAYLVGITGPPGSGKSTLVEKLVLSWTAEEEKVAVIAIDPSSEFSGGALLGDRIRMGKISTEKNVFIRSMATRGYLGGLNPAIFDTVVVLSAAGYQKVVIETVGVGQNEIDIVRLADTTLVVTVPEAGDEIQTFKAGLMEAGDIFVLNKADQPTASRMELILKQMLEMNDSENHSSDNSNWEVPIVKTVGTEGEGIEELRRAVMQHRDFLSRSRKERYNHSRVIRNHVVHLMEEFLRNHYIDPLLESSAFQEILAGISARKTDPYTAVEQLLKSFNKEQGKHEN